MTPPRLNLVRLQLTDGRAVAALEVSGGALLAPMHFPLELSSAVRLAAGLLTAAGDADAENRAAASLVAGVLSNMRPGA